MAGHRRGACQAGNAALPGIASCSPHRRREGSSIEVTTTANGTLRTVSEETRGSDATSTWSVTRDQFGQVHVRLGGAIGFSGGITCYDHLGLAQEVGTMATFDAGRGGMQLGWGGSTSLLVFTGGLRAAYLKGWNDRDASELPRHIVGCIQPRGYWGAEAVLSLFRLGPAVEVGAYRSVGDPHESLVAVGYGCGF